ncbi:MAG TPA: FAD-binding domain-containing protein, partial [Nocardioidaceae bacterium]|nr:FAD-binding domain-containing protein [Nocardioidaceae bacterium]
HPRSAREYLREQLADMQYDLPGAQLDAWRAGRTGFPVVDAGMRQMQREGWMHNRVRMITASFLVKDLYVAWQHGARHFLHWLVDGYGTDRDRPDLDRTSRMSVHLKWGEIHPRTMLADLAGRGGDSVRTYRQELAWREFYADVLHHHPRSAREYLREQLADMQYDLPGAQLDAWRAGRTGFPVVDAGMRQMQREGWMHNRVRMITASFLVKDLHVEWQHGARHFLHWLVDGDLASNNHGWQWVAGSGTDPVPYFRVFNPVTQGRKFDPDGAYVRRYVEELRDVPGAAVHEPWLLPGGPPNGYPRPIVDHKAERVEALRRYEATRAR